MGFFLHSTNFLLEGSQQKMSSYYHLSALQQAQKYYWLKLYELEFMNLKDTADVAWYKHLLCRSVDGYRSD